MSSIKDLFHVQCHLWQIGELMECKYIQILRNCLL